MHRQRYVVMGAGQVGFHLARVLSQSGHEVVVVEKNPRRRELIEEQLDVAVVGGNGAHIPVLEQAEVGKADLLMAVSSSDEANFVSSRLAKSLGARRTVVRVQVAEDVTSYRRQYQSAFDADLILSTQLLTTMKILDSIRGHDTVAVEYFAAGKVQLRKFHLGADSALTQKSLAELDLPKGSLVVGLYHGDRLTIPSGNSRAEPGSDALVLALTEVMPEVVSAVAARPEKLGRVVLAGGGETAVTVAQAFAGWDVRLKIIEANRQRAFELANRFPRYQVIHGDATDLAVLKAERIGRSGTFVALTGHDERNLMASLLAQELGVPKVVALVSRSETLRLWKRMGLENVISPRALAYERIREYVEGGYRATMVWLEQGAQILERALAPASPAAGVTLAEINPPPGLIVGAVARGERVFVPRGNHRLEVGDTVVLFVSESELDTVRLLFPGHDE